MRGIIVRIPTDKETGERKGFLFVRGEDGVERFVHRSGLEQTAPSFDRLQVRTRVEFTPLDDAPKGPRAIELRVLA